MSPQIGDLSAAERNKRPIFDVLAEWLGDAGAVLEIGAGDGTHARFARQCLPHLRWQASETPTQLPYLKARLAGACDADIPTPLALDVQGQWPAARYDAIFAANVAHIMNEGAVAALFAAASGHLNDGGLLCLYGPFFDRHERPGSGNLAFDRALRARDPAMGLRTRQTLAELARAHGLEARVCRLMPSDNRLLIWTRPVATG